MPRSTCDRTTWRSSASGTAGPAGARVERLTSLGGVVRIDLSINGDHRIQLELISDQSLDLEFAPGDTVFVTPRHMNVFDAQSHTFHPFVLGRETEAKA